MFWAAIFFTLAVATGLFAFGGVAASAAGAAQIAFYGCLTVALVALLSAFMDKLN